MTASKQADVVHRRAGPGIEVGRCGARGPQLKFAQTIRYITCEECKARHQVTASADRERFQKELTARRKAGRSGKPAMRFW